MQNKMKELEIKYFEVVFRINKAKKWNLFFFGTEEVFLKFLII